MATTQPATLEYRPSPIPAIPRPARAISSRCSTRSPNSEATQSRVMLDLALSCRTKAILILWATPYTTKKTFISVSIHQVNQFQRKIRVSSDPLNLTTSTQKIYIQQKKNLTTSSKNPIAPNLEPQVSTVCQIPDLELQTHPYKVRGCPRIPMLRLMCQAQAISTLMVRDICPNREKQTTWVI